MWCYRCKTEIDMPAPPTVESYRGNVPLADFSTSACPHCGSPLFSHADIDSQHAEAPIDGWEEHLEQELAEVRELLEESSRLRESTTRVDPPVTKTLETPEHAERPKVAYTKEGPKNFGRMRRPVKYLMPRTPAIILLLLGLGLMSGPWIQGFESIGQHGLSLEWAGQVLLSVGALLWLRDYVQQGQELSGKMDATIAGLHLLRREIATPAQSDDAHLQLAELKRRLAAVARSVKF